ncbi:hypothetical protein M3G03_00865 [Aestuariimicrobium sp. p3-SID1156]|uniref:hypothetical protein n=1 Tax=Aestuariimicrobium sp. p3-SID1156 TaxID=2916038 RepID=UPI00223B2C18|nr:hypothetical protein [Aestuariimicrobium sp. p3-SID1156]MCT1458107.1 hypothetical protein [Aestuariimicrobium sp. p3-SID1156]
MSLTVLPTTLLLLILTPALMVRRQRLLPDRLTHPALRQMRSLQLTSRWLGLVIAALIALAAMVTPSRFGRGFMMAPGLFSYGMLLALLGGELWVWRCARTDGVASLETRSNTSYISWRPVATLATCLAVLAVLLVWALGTQDSDPSSYSYGRAHVTVHPDGGTSSWGPFPGSFYSGPIAIMLAIGLVMLALGIVITLRRPRNGADPVVVAVDDAARRETIEAMIAAVTAGVAGTLVFCSLLSIRGSLWWLVASVTGVVACAWAFSVLLVPGRGKLVR